MAVGNIYVISAIAIVGGGLFGFDIASMSAIIRPNVTSTRGPLLWMPRNARDRRPTCKEVSPQRCLEDPGSGRWSLDIYPTGLVERSQSWLARDSGKPCSLTPATMPWLTDVGLLARYSSVPRKILACSSLGVSSTVSTSASALLKSPSTSQS